jgi:uncharacterized protein (DUF2141 family)
MAARWAIVAAAALCLVSAVGGDDTHAGPKSGQFRIVVPALASNDGVVVISVHDASTFATENLKKREAGDELMKTAVKINDREAVWTTDPLPFGGYAIVVHHDVNADGFVNFATILPTEAVGYSNYDRAIASYPEFEKARVTLDAPLREMRIEAFMQGRIFRKYLKQ